MRATVNPTLLRGQDAEFEITVAANDGSALDLEGQTLLFQARPTVYGELVIEKQSGDGIEHGEETGTATLTLDPEDIEDAPSRLRWGLWLVDDGGRRHPLIERAYLYVKDAVVREGS